MKKLLPQALVFFITGLLALGGAALSSAAEAITEEQATAILNELKQIRVLLEKQQARNADATRTQQTTPNVGPSVGATS